jgi:hypothetical protein
MALDATVAGPASNSYPDVAYADAFFANRLELDDWDAIVDQDLALMTATAYVESSYQPFGYRASTTQALNFPRYDVEKPDSVWGSYSYYLPTEIPKPLKDAVCLFALSFASPAGTGSSSGAASSQTLKIGKSIAFETKTETSSSSSSASSGGILGEAGRLLRGLVKGTSGVPMMRA